VPLRSVLRWMVVAAVLASVALGARPASAEWFADLYAGTSFTQKSVFT